MGINLRKRRKMRESPESLMTPYESEEIYPTITLELCDNCKWSCSRLSAKDSTESCPVCNADIESHIPMTSEEVSRIEIDGERGMILQFSRRMLVQ
jgi:hypothetical protein